MTPLAALGDSFQNVLIWTFNFATAYPKTAGGLAAWLVMSFCVTNVVRGIYPPCKWQTEDRPLLARATLALLDPFALNFWRVIEWLLKKVGVTPVSPPGDITAPYRVVVQ